MSYQLKFKRYGLLKNGHHTTFNTEQKPYSKMPRHDKMRNNSNDEANDLIKDKP